MLEVVEALSLAACAVSLALILPIAAAFCKSRSLRELPARLQFTVCATDGLWMASCVLTILIRAGGSTPECSFLGFLGHWLALVSCLWNALLFFNLKRLLTQGQSADIRMLASDEKRFHAWVWPVSAAIAAVPLLGELGVWKLSTGGVPIYTISDYGVCNIDLRYDVLRLCTQSGIAALSLLYMAGMHVWAVRYVRRTYPHDVFGLRRVRVRGARYLLAFTLVWLFLIVEDVFLLAAPQDVTKIPQGIQLTKAVLFYSQGALNALVYASNKWHLLQEVLPATLVGMLLWPAAIGRGVADVAIRFASIFIPFYKDDGYGNAASDTASGGVGGGGAGDSSMRKAAAAFVGRARLEATPRTPGTTTTTTTPHSYRSGGADTGGTRSSAGSILSDVATAMGDGGYGHGHGHGHGGASDSDGGVRRALVFAGTDAVDAWNWGAEELSASEAAAMVVASPGSAVRGAGARGGATERTRLLDSGGGGGVRPALLVLPSPEEKEQGATGFTGTADKAGRRGREAEQERMRQLSASSGSTPRLSFLAAEAEAEAEEGAGVRRGPPTGSSYRVVNLLHDDEAQQQQQRAGRSSRRGTTAGDDDSDVGSAGELDVSLGSADVGVRLSVSEGEGEGGTDAEAENAEEEQGDSGGSDSDGVSPIVVRVSSKGRGR